MDHQISPALCHAVAVPVDVFLDMLAHIGDNRKRDEFRQAAEPMIASLFFDRSDIALQLDNEVDYMDAGDERIAALTVPENRAALIDAALARALYSDDFAAQIYGMVNDEIRDLVTDQLAELYPLPGAAPAA